jgi:hypothetical protein
MGTGSMDLSMMVTSRPDFKNEPAGFGGLKWGTEISSLKPSGFYDGGITFDEVTLYRRKDDVFQIGRARVRRIYYGFWRGRFYSVLIYVKGLDNFTHLKQVCFEKFGKGYKPNSFIERYTWGGETTGILIDYNDLLREGRLRLVSTRLTHQIERQKRLGDEGGLAKGFEKLRGGIGRLIK